MSGKKMLIIMVAMGVVGFGATFFVTNMMRVPAEVDAKVPQSERRDQENAQVIAQMDSLSPREKQLQELIQEVRERISEVERSRRELDEREKRIRMAREELRREAEELEDLRVQLSTPLVRLKELKRELERTRIEIARSEQENLRRAANVYAKMPAEESSRILMAMCGDNKFDDAAKILHFMSETSVAKVIAEIKDAHVAANLVGAMKRIKQQEG